MKKTLLFFSCFLVLLIVPQNEIIFADHGSGGGGCSGDCSPPTLGQDNSGVDFVRNGFSINDEQYNVNHFKQDIPTQFVNAGEPVEIKLKIYENSGTQNLSHVGLLLGLEEKMVSGVKVNSHPVKIIWEQNFEGIISFNVEDPDNLISEVNVKNELVRDAFGEKEGLNQIIFEFTPLKQFDTDVILVEMWDYDRNSWTNYFNNPLRIENSKSEENDFTENKFLEPLVPDWFKTNAGFWSKNQIDDKTFSNGIKYLIKEKIMNVPNIKEYDFQPQLHFIEVEKGPQHYIDRYYNEESYKTWFDSNYPDITIEQAVGYSHDLVIPDWIKSNADLWANDLITDKEFVEGIKYLIENGIIIL